MGSEPDAPHGSQDCLWHRSPFASPPRQRNGRFAEAAYLKDGFSQEMYDKGIETVFEGSDGYHSSNGRPKLQSSLEITGALLPFSLGPAREIVSFLGERCLGVYFHYYHNPRSGAISPARRASGQTYALSERALTLLLATEIPRLTRRIVLA